MTSPLQSPLLRPSTPNSASMVPTEAPKKKNSFSFFSCCSGEQEDYSKLEEYNNIPRKKIDHAQDKNTFMMLANKVDILVCLAQFKYARKYGTKVEQNAKLVELSQIVLGENPYKACLSLVKNKSAAWKVALPNTFKSCISELSKEDFAQFRAKMNGEDFLFIANISNAPSPQNSLSEKPTFIPKKRTTRVVELPGFAINIEPAYAERIRFQTKCREAFTYFERYLNSSEQFSPNYNDFKNWLIDRPTLAELFRCLLIDLPLELDSVTTRLYQSIISMPNGEVGFYQSLATCSFFISGEPILRENIDLFLTVLNKYIDLFSERGGNVLENRNNQYLSSAYIHYFNNIKTHEENEQKRQIIYLSPGQDVTNSINYILEEIQKIKIKDIFKIVLVELSGDHYEVSSLLNSRELLNQLNDALSTIGFHISVNNDNYDLPEIKADGNCLLSAIEVCTQSTTTTTIPFTEPVS